MFEEEKEKLWHTAGDSIEDMIVKTEFVEKCSRLAGEGGKG